MNQFGWDDDVLFSKRDARPRDNLLKIAFMVFRGLLVSLSCTRVRGFVFVGRSVQIRQPHRVFYYGRVIIEDYAEIQGLSTHGVHLANNTSIGRGAVIRPSGYYARKIGKGLQLGQGSSIGIMNYIGCGGGVIIGENVMMGPCVTIHSENHRFDSVDATIKEQGVVRSGVEIEDDCWLGAGSRILAGVKIGKGSIVAAGAVVNRDVPSNSIVAGVPAKLIGARNCD